MKTTVFLTLRQQALPNWLAAFPDARVCRYSSSTDIPNEFDDALIWLQIDDRTRAPAKLVEAIRHGSPNSRIAVLSNLPYDEQGLAVLEAGALGYCAALAAPEVLRQMATVICSGGVWIGPGLMERLLRAVKKRATKLPANDQIEKLSPREREVALAVGAGATNKEVARQLGIGERTVKAHLASIFETLGVRDRLQLALLLSGLRMPDADSREDRSDMSARRTS